MCTAKALWLFWQRMDDQSCVVCEYNKCTICYSQQGRRKQKFTSWSANFIIIYHSHTLLLTYWWNCCGLNWLLVPTVLTVQLWIWVAVCVRLLSNVRYEIINRGCVLIKMNSNKIRRKYWSGSCRVCRTCSAGTATPAVMSTKSYVLL